MDADSIIEYLEKKGDDPTRGLNKNLASLVPTKDTYYLDNVLLYDVMTRTNRIFDILEDDLDIVIEDEWRNTVRLAELARQNSDLEILLTRGFDTRILQEQSEGRYPRGAEIDEGTISTVRDYFQNVGQEIHLPHYSQRTSPADSNPDTYDRKMAEAAFQNDAAILTFDSDLLAYRGQGIEVSTPANGLEAWESKLKKKK